MKPKRLTRIMSVWCDKQSGFCDRCDPNCEHAYLEFDYDEEREVMAE